MSEAGAEQGSEQGREQGSEQKEPGKREKGTLLEPPPGGWDSRWIMKVLPHRYPFLLVDRVLEIRLGESIVALKNVTVNEDFFNGHFPEQPVMPGVLLIEAMAQAGAILVLQDHPDADSGKLLYFMGVERARFRRPVVPGDQVRFEITMLHRRTNHCKLSGKALVDGKVAAEATVSSAMVDPNA